jgi:hypothetical protein
MIELEPVPDEWLTQAWTAGDPHFQIRREHLLFACRVYRPPFRFRAVRPVTLSTGEELEKLEGSVMLLRGERLKPAGQGVGVICYNAATPADPARGERGRSASYSVELELSGRAYDQFVAACERGVPPILRLVFEMMGPIRLVPPEGVATKWDTKQSPFVPIEGAQFFRELARYVPVAPHEDEEEPEAVPEVPRPTFEQLAQGFEQLQAQLGRLRAGVGLVFWTTVAIACILVFRH